MYLYIEKQLIVLFFPAKLVLCWHTLYMRVYFTGTLKFYVDEYNKGYVSLEALVAALKELFNTQAKVFGLKLFWSSV